MGDCSVSKYEMTPSAFAYFVRERVDLLASVGFSVSVDGVENKINKHSQNGLFPEPLRSSCMKLWALGETP